MDLGIDGKVALVTGGSRLIGLAIARRLGLEGAKVAICGRDSRRLEEAGHLLREQGIRAFTYPADVRDDAQVEGLLQAVTEEFGGLDLLVNNPGGIVRTGPFSTVSLEEWRLGYEVNVVSILRVVRAALPSLKAAPWGRIVNLGAFYVSPGTPGLLTELAENAVAKTSVAALTKVMSEELAPNITVNCVAPGPVGDAHAMREMTRTFPIPRAADPGELADLVAFLCSRQAGYITGLTIPFDGGASRRLV